MQLDENKQESVTKAPGGHSLQQTKEELFQELYKINPTIKLKHVYWWQDDNVENNEILNLIASHGTISDPKLYTLDDSLMFKSVTRVPVMDGNRLGYSYYTLIVSLLDDDLVTRTIKGRALVQPNEWQYDSYNDENHIRLADLEFNDGLFICNPITLKIIDCQGLQCRKKSETWCVSCYGTLATVYDLMELINTEVSIKNFGLHDIIHISKTFKALDVTNEDDLRRFSNEMEWLLNDITKTQTEAKEFEIKIKAIIEKTTQEHQEKMYELSSRLSLQLNQKVDWNGDKVVGLVNRGLGDGRDGGTVTRVSQMIQIIQKQVKDKIIELHISKK